MKLKITTVLNTEYIIDCPKFRNTYHCDGNLINDIHIATHWLLWRYTDNDNNDTEHHIHVTTERKIYGDRSIVIITVDKLIKKDHIVEFEKYKQ